MKIAVIGTGYVGLVSGACFADFGHKVVCVDKDDLKIARLRQGDIPIYEPGLDVLVCGNLAIGRLAFTTNLAAALKDVDVVFIAVGTPPDRRDGGADLSYVYQAATEVADTLTGPAVIATKSTVPVGTGDEIHRIVQELRPDLDLEVVSNPEFLREGAAIDDFKRPDRVVVGVESEAARDVMRLLYRPLFLNETPMLFTRRRTAELIKYAANAFLATKISFINEIADLCERMGADVQDVARGLGFDRRIGAKFLHPGPGFGGSCFPKDTLALIRTAEQAGVPSRIVSTVLDVNNARKVKMAERIVEACGGSVAGRRIGVLGVTFKPRTDDMREAPSIPIVAALKAAGATVAAYDPAGMKEARKLPEFEGVLWCSDAEAVMSGSHALAILTEWDEFRALDLARVRSLLLRPIVVDFRNIYTLDEMRQAGIEYFSIGREPVRAVGAAGGMPSRAAAQRH
jgi:UDPglucose 6-dehydrogenase